MQIELRWLSYVRALPAARQMTLGAVVCLLLGLGILAAGSRFVDTTQPHLWGPLNDQIGYITVARNLLTNGTVQGDSVLPSTLWQKKSRYVLYMPGHSATIALSYRLFGVGAFQSIIPSLVSYLITMLAIYFIGARVYSPLVGLVASLLFALYPPALFFAFTAMAELTFVAAYTVAVCACLYLPYRLRPWLAPFCIAVPFLFREAAALAVVPLGFYFWLEHREKPVWRPLVFVALSVVILVVIFRFDFSAGRPSLLKANVFGDWHAVYDDATAQQAAANAGWRDWLRVLPGRTANNVKSVFFNPDFAPGASGANYTLMAVMILVAVVAVRRGDNLAWALTALNAIAATAALVFVGTSGYRGARHLMFTYALNVIVIGSLLVKLHSRGGYIKRSTIIAAVASTSAAVLSLYSLGAIRNFYAALADQSLIDRSRISILVNIGYALIVGTALVVLVAVWRGHKRRRVDVPRMTVMSKVRASFLFRNFSAFAIATGFGLLVLSGNSGYRSMRYLLFVYTVSVVVIAWLLAKVTWRVTARHATQVAASAGAVAFLIFSLVVVRNMFTFYVEQDVVDCRYGKALETVGHDNTRMLVTPFDLSIRYRYDHFPVPWAFLPYDQPTLELLAARFDIGTMILRNDHPLLQNPAMLAGLGFYKDRVLTIGGVNYLVYKRPAP